MSNNSMGFLYYKGKPLVKSGDTIYYGDMRDKYVVMLNILTKVDVDREKVFGNIKIQLMSTDVSSNPSDIIIKKSEKEGIYVSLDLAAIWLERALAE
ncbi:MAG: hypothetical protein KFW09_00860 [Oscillospiraceae bacterium]|nr:hypothetical protein [Oscillospiraceae bacterium]